MFLNNLGTYSGKKDYLTQAANHSVQFHYGARIIYVSSSAARTQFVLFGISAGCTVVLVVSGFFVPGIFERRKPNDTHPDIKSK